MRRTVDELSFFFARRLRRLLILLGRKERKATDTARSRKIDEGLDERRKQPKSDSKQKEKKRLGDFAVRTRGRIGGDGGVFGFFPRRDDGRESGEDAFALLRRDLRRGGEPLRTGSRERGEKVWRSVLERCGILGVGFRSVADLTLADLDAMFEARRVEEWERTAFLATYAANANPYRKRWLDVKNPFRAGASDAAVERVDLADVPFD
jgi:hypothetical protein